MKAIETSYCGYRFRSRLEARWAIFFETLGLKWEYEPEGFDLGFGVWYLPDFRVWYPGRCAEEGRYQWFEVKADIRRIRPEEWQRMVLFSRQESLLLLDGPPSEKVYLTIDSIVGGWFAPGSLGPFDGFVPPAAHTEAAVKPERQGYALWSGYERMWCDFGPEVFSLYPDDQSTIGLEAVTALRGAIRAAREFNMRKAVTA